MRPLFGAMSGLVDRIPTLAFTRRGVLRQPHKFSPLRTMHSGNIKWLWPADRESIGFHVGHIHSSRIGIYGMTVRSREPLKEDHIKEAVKHLQRKTPSLRITLQRRGDTYWFCEPCTLDVDIKVVHGGRSIEEEVENVRLEGIISEEFLPWKLRFFPRGEDSSLGTFRHKYDVLFTGHHATGDGVSAGRLVYFMFDLLNDVISGNEIDEEEYGQLIYNEEVWELERRVMQKLKEDPNRLLSVKESLPPPGRPLLFLEIFPRPTGVPASTRHAVRVLNERVTANLHKKCKENGVTFNSAFTAAINVAILRLAKKAGVSRKSYRIASTHAVNISRYLKETPINAAGGYGLAYSFTSEVDDSDSKNFWHYCRILNKGMKEAYRTGLPLEQKVTQLITGPTVSPEEWFRDPPPVVHDFGVSNVGNLSMMDPDEEDHIFVSSITCYNLVQNFVHMNFFQVLTFRGHCSFTLSYATNYVADETANILVNEVQSVLQEISEYSNL